MGADGRAGMKMAAGGGSRVAVVILGMNVIERRLDHAPERRNQSQG